MQSHTPNMAKRKDDQEQRKVKLVIVGDSGVGKSWLLSSFASDVVPKKDALTLYDSHSKHVVVDDTSYLVSVWDTCGLEGYNMLRSLNYPDTDAFLLCYAVDSQSSYDNISEMWYPEVTHHCPDTPVLLVATKTDLYVSHDTSSPSLCSLRDGEMLAKQMNSCHIETSAFTQKGVKECFTIAVKLVTKKSRSSSTSSSTPSKKKRKRFSLWRSKQKDT